jgi:hypothetical protein
MHAIIAALAARHGLSRAEVLEEIEAAFSEALSRWYRLEVLVHVRDDLRLEAVAYNRVSGVTLQKLVDLPALSHRIFNWNPPFATGDIKHVRE